MGEAIPQWMREIVAKVNREAYAEIRQKEADEMLANSVGGVLWADAKLPPRFHRCYAHTTGWVGFDKIQRCACGATRNTRFRGWLEKNSRRKSA